MRWEDAVLDIHCKFGLISFWKPPPKQMGVYEMESEPVTKSFHNLHVKPLTCGHMTSK